MQNFLEIPIRSEVCLNPNACYPVQTFLPSWLIIGLAVITYLTITNSIKKR